MNKKIILSISVIAIGAALALTAFNAAEAYQGDYTQKGPNYTADRHVAMEKAFDNNDYEAWKNLMSGKGQVTRVINKDNFKQFAEAHKLAEQGKYSEADTIRQNLGLKTKGNQTGSNQGRGLGRGNCSR